MGVDGLDNKMLPFECSFIGSPSILINLTGYVRTWIFAGKDPITVINRGGSSNEGWARSWDEISLPNKHVIGNI